MLAATVAQIRNLDRRTIEEKGVSGETLMERAGQGLLDSVIRLIGPLEKKRFAIFCGKGNNGGDGFVLARLLLEKNALASCFLTDSPESIHGDAKTVFLKLNPAVSKIIRHPEELPNPGAFDLAVDALFGSGFQGILKGISVDFVHWINGFPGPVLSVDVPSGANLDTGLVSQPCVQADRTVSMGLSKVGHFFHPCKEHCGELAVHDLGFSPGLIQEENISTEIIDRDWAKHYLPKRKNDGHKGDFGKILMIAGSRGMSGAAVLAGRAALRAGAGMVMVALPQSVQPVVAGMQPELMTLPLPETSQGTLSEKAEQVLLDKIESWADVLVIGPGAGTMPETAGLLRRLVQKAEKPAVVDADALNAFKGRLEEMQTIPFPRIFTPHRGEWTRLAGPLPDISGAALIEWLCQYSRMHLQNVLLFKGAPTLIARPNGHCFLNATGNSGMATAGSGDVLSGIIAGLWAQKMEPDTAAGLGAFLHGLSGDLAVRELGEHSLIAGDLIEYLPRAFLNLESERK